MHAPSKRRAWRGLISCLLLMGLLLIPAQPAAAQTEDATKETANEAGLAPLAITTYTLDNGLEVILVEDHSAPTVAVNLWYEVGGADDPANRSGFAHLFEHMMFQGSAHVEPGEHAALVNAAGGNYNATTGIDRTNYFEVLPAHQLPLGLWLEADRLRSLRLTEENFDREVEVVKEEYRLRVENQPYGEASLRLQTLPFDYAPYQNPVIGSIADLEAATLDEIRDFHATYYVPNNVTLTVAGDIDVEQTRELIQRYFGDIEAADAPPALPDYSYTPQTSRTAITMTDELARVPATLIGYRLPPRDDPDYYALDVLARILGAGRSSRLAQALMDTGLAASASAGIDGNRGPSLFTVVLVPNPGVELDQLEQIYHEELERIQSEGVDPAELEKAVNQIRTQTAQQLERAFFLAESVQSANFFLGDPQAVLDDLAAYQAVTAADVQAAAARYLASDQQNLIRVQPAGMAQDEAGIGSETAMTQTVTQTTTTAVTATATPVAATSPLATPVPTATPAAAMTSTAALTSTSTLTATIEDAADVLTQPPAPLPVAALSLPEVVTETLDNGMTVMVVPDSSVPLVTLYLVVPGGASAVPADKAGLASITAGLLTRGTETRSAQEIASTIEQVGGTLAAGADGSTTTLFSSVLSEQIDLAFDLLGDVALHPTFPEDELATQRLQALTSLAAITANPNAVASRVFNAVVYGDHPYGYVTTEETLQSITRDDVLAAYAAQFDPAQAILVVAGDVTVDQALDLARGTFGDWEGTGAATPLDFPPLAERSEQTIYLVDRPDATQATIMLGHLGISPTSPDRYAVQVLDHILGGGPSSRLFQKLREEEGYTYGVASNFGTPLDRGTFVVQTSVRNEVVGAALDDILAELTQLRDAPVPARELADAKDYLIGSYALQLETAEALADALVRLKLAGLPLANVERYPQSIKSVDEQALEAAARAHLRPDDLAIVVVGDAAAIEDELAAIAPVVRVDDQGQPVESPQ